MSHIRLLTKRLLATSNFNNKLFGSILKDQLVKKSSIPNIFVSFGKKKNNFCTMADGGNIPTKEELAKKLTPLQYHVTQEKGTERPFTGEFDKTFDEGTYSCIVCGQYLFSSNTKYDSGCGWPAFNDVLEKGRIKLLPDTSGDRVDSKFLANVLPDCRLLEGFDENERWQNKKRPAACMARVGGNLLLLIANPGRIRTEVQCSKCSAHLGHVFDDGPKPTGKRYCINSASINFLPGKGANST